MKPLVIGFIFGAGLQFMASALGLEGRRRWFFVVGVLLAMGSFAFAVQP